MASMTFLVVRCSFFREAKRTLWSQNSACSTVMSFIGGKLLGGVGARRRSGAAGITIPFLRGLRRGGELRAARKGRRLQGPDGGERGIALVIIVGRGKKSGVGPPQSKKSGARQLQCGGYS